MLRDKLGRFIKGNKVNIGHKHTEEAKRKIGLGNKGKKVSKETCRKISQSNKGKHYFWKGKKQPLEMIEKRVKKIRGIPRSEETKRKIGLKSKGRIMSEETKIRICHTWFKKGESGGSKNLNWKGGRTSLWRQIRNLPENKEWRKEIFERDSYTCQECGNSESGFLRAHHKKRFSIILSEFLQEYDQFSPIEDKETLIRLALKYQSFWDIGNGITLCKRCHKKTKSYGLKRRSNYG